MMKAKLIKENNGYTLFVDGKVFGDTDGHPLKSITNRLSLKNCQAIELGYDLDELAELKFTDTDGDVSYDKGLIIGFKAGFQKALDLMGDKKFSEEDIHEAYFLGERGDRSGFHNLLQSLQQTEWNVEVEMEYVGECHGNNGNGCFQDSPGHNCGCFKQDPKLDENGCLILKRI